MNMNTVFMNMNILYARGAGGGRMSQCTSPCMQHGHVRMVGCVCVSSVVSQDGGLALCLASHRTA